MYIYFSTLGCKLNYTETSAIKQIAQKIGYKPTRNVQEANIIIINTCTVTHTADKKSRYAIRHLHHQNPNATIIVTGCYADTNQEEIKNIEGVSVVATNGQKKYFEQILKDKANKILESDSTNFF